MSEQAHADNLKASRAGSLKNSLQNAKKNIDAAKNIGSLLSYIDPMMDWLFGLSLAAAILKDIFDLLDTAMIALGGIGMILIFISTSMASAVIMVTMFLTGSSSKVKSSKKIIQKILILVGATLVEFLPGIDVLPVETITVIVIIWMTLVERKVAADKEREEKKDAEQQPKKPNHDSKPAATTAEKVA